jgi:hypothetical protein
MKIPVGLVALFFTTCAFAQNAPPKVGTKPLAQVKPSAPMGCKLVGAVKSRSGQKHQDLGRRLYRRRADLRRDVGY